MKKLFILLALFSCHCYADDQIISKTDLVGTWETFFGFGNKPPQNATLNQLVIHKDYAVSFERRSPKGEIQKFSTKKNGVVISEDIFIIQFRKNHKLRYKLVVSGWKDKRMTLLFGTLYMYDNHRLFNGLPISFKRVTANNTLGSDAQKTDCVLP